MLHMYARGVVRETYAFAKRTGRHPAATTEALRALADAAVLVGEAPGEGGPCR
jgi:hypothetical protein